MSNKVNMTLRIEPELKAQEAILFEALGMDLSTASGRLLDVMDSHLKLKLKNPMK